MHTIEIDEEVMGVLKTEAEPFDDTPNTVLRRLLLAPENTRPSGKGSPNTASSGVFGVPKALSHVLEVTRVVRQAGLSRVDATHRVAKNERVAFQTVLDKYCRQLGLTAAAFDMLLTEPELLGLKKRLCARFPEHDETITRSLDEL